MSPYPALLSTGTKIAQIVKIAGGDAKAASAASAALEARRRIDAMFKVDSKFDDMEPGARKAARDAELRPLMEDFGGWARAQLPLASPKLALHRALQYAVEFWPYVMNVLEDGHLELSNNAEEGLWRHSGLKHTATQRCKRPGLFHPYAGMVLDVSCYAVILTLAL